MSCKSTWHLAIGILDLPSCSPCPWCSWVLHCLQTLPLSGPLGCIHIWQYHSQASKWDAMYAMMAMVPALESQQGFSSHMP